MASKKTNTKTPKAPAAVKAVKVAKGPKAAKSTAPRHPKARVTAAHGGKAELAKALSSSLARGDQSADDVATQLTTASNKQLLRLQQIVETVKKRWGNRDKLIAAIGTAQKKSTDKDFLAKLETYSLPQLVDLAASAERSARS
jgi:enoyl-[acyl-carrier-protein] reductase (NADH)